MGTKIEWLTCIHSHYRLHNCDVANLFVVLHCVIETVLNLVHQLFIDDDHHQLKQRRVNNYVGI